MFPGTMWIMRARSHLHPIISRSSLHRAIGASDQRRNRDRGCARRLQARRPPSPNTSCHLVDVPALPLAEDTPRAFRSVSEPQLLGAGQEVPDLGRGPSESGSHPCVGIRFVREKNRAAYRKRRSADDAPETPPRKVGRGLSMRAFAGALKSRLQGASWRATPNIDPQGVSPGPQRWQARARPTHRPHGPRPKPRG